MVDTNTAKPLSQFRWRRLDKVWLTIVAIPLALALFAPAQFMPTMTFATASFLKTSVFIAFAVLLTGWLRASSLESVVSKAFKRRKISMIVLASLVGGLSPFCSCEVIPFIAALLAAGAPLSPVMAFWLASPLIDPPMFLITASVLGVDFAVAKTVAAVAIGLAGGLVILGIESLGLQRQLLRANSPMVSCCGVDGLNKLVMWRFWQDNERIGVFRSILIENALFLSKWLFLAYLLQSLMVAWIPTDWIADSFGGQGVGSIVLGALIGVPAYLNGYAAVPLLDGLIAQGMTQGTAMAFLIAGGITCVPAAMAVWAIAHPAIFAQYIVLAFMGAVAAGTAWSLV